jgi:hypothetical protein
MIDWAAILLSITLTAIMVYFGFIALEYPFIKQKDKTVFKTFVNWYKQLK